jgi:hypothetical protein
MGETYRWLHHSANRLARFGFPFDDHRIPKDGIYLLEEEGETGHGEDGIVRVGMHTGEVQLPSRLQQHFLKEPKEVFLWIILSDNLLECSQPPFDLHEAGQGILEGRNR